MTLTKEKIVDTLEEIDSQHLVRITDKEERHCVCQHSPKKIDRHSLRPAKKHKSQIQVQVPQCQGRTGPHSIQRQRQSINTVPLHKQAASPGQTPTTQKRPDPHTQRPEMPQITSQVRMAIQRGWTEKIQTNSKSPQPQTEIQRQMHRSNSHWEMVPGSLEPGKESSVPLNDQQKAREREKEKHKHCPFKKKRISL